MANMAATMAVKQKRNDRRNATRCCIITAISLMVMLLLLFLVIFVAIPLIFKYNIQIQRNIIFPVWNIGTRNFSNFTEYGIRGARNFYVTVNKEENITLGVWHILPESLIPNTIIYKFFDYDNALSNSSYPIIMHLHGNSNVRTDTKPIYTVLRKFFHVIAFDYRGYGDSTKAELNEQGVVNDTVALYRWIRKRTNAPIYFWGHSLGTGVGTQTIAKLTDEGIEQPAGLILEAPFSSIIDVVRDNSLVKLYSWLPWFETTIIDPFQYNGLEFDSCKHIAKVDCPIMILHAKDDTIIPAKFAAKLYSAALQSRKEDAGNITFHLFEPVGYNHLFIYKAKQLPVYIENFVNICIDYERTKKGTM